MKKNLSVAAFGFVFMLIVMRWQGAGLVTPISLKGIVDLEFATTNLRVQELLLHWNMTSLKMNIWLDFLFIVSYVLFFSLAAESLAYKWADAGLMRKLGLWLARLAYVAGVFDIAENLLMLQTVAGNHTDASLHLTYYCATLKFGLIACIILYVIISLPKIFRKNS